MIVIRRPLPNEKGAVRRMWEECFPEGGPRYVRWYFSRVYRSDWTLGLFDGPALLSSLQMIPYNLKLRGRAVGLETLTGVATGAAWRKHGFARALMAEALSDMAARGVGLTFLYPFNHDFYKHLGWETCSDTWEHLTPVESLLDAVPPGWTVTAASRRDISGFSTVYEKFMQGRHCFSVRGAAEWEKRVGENRSNSGSMLLAKAYGEPVAYALCEDQNGETMVGELAWARDGAVGAVLSALKRKNKPVCWASPDDGGPSSTFGFESGALRLLQHVMFRVADVPLAISQAVAEAPGDIVIEVAGDTMRPENNGRFRIWSDGVSAHAERTQDEPRFTCDVGALAWMLTGYKDAMEIAKAGRGMGEDEIIKLLVRMYPKQRNFLFELY